MAKIIYLMGSSGSGKDSIISEIRKQSIQDLQVAHRYITRPWQSGGENHIGLSESEYERRKALDLFALYWSANQHHYAIGREIDTWLNAGQNVLVNGSRGYLAQAEKRYPQMIFPVMIDVEIDKLKGRLIKRGRETLSEIDARIKRHENYRQQITQCHVIENNHHITNAARALAKLIENLKN